MENDVDFKASPRPNEASSGNFLNPPVEPHLFTVTLTNVMSALKKLP